jgi:hypothetical protein
MHRTKVIDDLDIVARRDEHSKVGRKRKVAQRSRRKNGWGSTRMYVLQNTCPFGLPRKNHRKLCEHPGPCKPGYGCGCYDAETHCDRNCGCPLNCESSRSFFPDLQVVQWNSWKVATEGLVVGVMSLTTRRGIFAMKSVHALKAARNAIPSFASHVMPGQ